MSECDNKIKIFVGYYKPNFIFSNNIYQPILTSNIDWSPDEIIKDNTGDNISEKNKNYGELSGHYWVLKNFLPATKSKYIGFCHYRRFLDFNLHESEFLPFKPIFLKDFQKYFGEYNEKNILKQISDYDIVIPEALPLKTVVFEQYVKWHPQEDMVLALNIIRDDYPEYVESALKVMGDNSMYTCLNFVMKKELVEEYLTWELDILTKLESKTDWSQYTDYRNVRTPAFIAERLFNVWLENKKKTKSKILNCTSFLLVGENYSNAKGEEYIEKYKMLVDLLKNPNFNTD